MKVVILADDVGSKLWPLASPQTPKALLPIYERQTMLENTVSRFLPLVDNNIRDIFVVLPEESVNLLYSMEIPQGLRLPTENIILLPYHYGSAFSLMTACHYLLSVKGCGQHDDVLVSPVDQYFWPATSFSYHMLNMIEGYRKDPKHLFLVSREAATAATNVGYIEVDWDDIKTIGLPLHLTDGTETATLSAQALNYYKPTIEAEAAEMALNRCVWDLSTYLWSINSFMGSLGEVLSDQHKMMIKNSFERSTKGIYYNYANMTDNTNLESVSLMEMAQHEVEVGQVNLAHMSSITWATLDNWIALKFLLIDSGIFDMGDLDGVNKIQSNGNLVLKPPSKSVALVGVEDLIIIDTGDKLLVGTPEAIHDHF